MIICTALAGFPASGGFNSRGTKFDCPNFFPFLLLFSTCFVRSLHSGVFFLLVHMGTPFKHGGLEAYVHGVRVFTVRYF